MSLRLPSRINAAKPKLRAILLVAAMWLPVSMFAAPNGVTFSSASPQVHRYDFIEITATVSAPDARNPFEDATLTGTFETSDGAHHWNVEGFCDSPDGATFRIRFMAPIAGDYKYSLTYKQGSFEKSSSGTFTGYEAPPRAAPRRPAVFLALHLGGHRGALLLQRHDCVLAGRLARRSRDSIHRRPSSPASRSTACA